MGSLPIKQPWRRQALFTSACDAAATASTSTAITSVSAELDMLVNEDAGGGGGCRALSMLLAHTMPMKPHALFLSIMIHTR
jgi:hypothetical protein